MRSAPDEVQLVCMASPALRAPSAAAGFTQEAALRGRLEQFGPATVLTFLDLERRSGELVVVSNDRVGRLWLRQGQVIRARIEGSRRVNRAAIYEMLSWDRGRFAFTQANLDAVTEEIDAPTTLLLMEAARRVDEAVMAAAT